LSLSLSLCERENEKKTERGWKGGREGEIDKKDLDKKDLDKKDLDKKNFLASSTEKKV